MEWPRRSLFCDALGCGALAGQIIRFLTVAARKAGVAARACENREIIRFLTCLRLPVRAARTQTGAGTHRQAVAAQKAGVAARPRAYRVYPDGRALARR